MQESIKGRLEECHLSLNEKKTQIVYCGSNRLYRNGEDKTTFDFLGFCFKLRTTLTRKGSLFQGYDCAISAKREKKIIGELRASGFQRWTASGLRRIIDHFNPKIIGWINYYGKYRKYRLQRIFRKFHERLISWAVNRHNRFKRSRVKAGKWQRRLAATHSNLFHHWSKGFGTA